LEQADVVAEKFRAAPGLTRELVEEISRQKGEPEWMLEKRLRGLELWEREPFPSWGPSLDGLDLANLAYFVRPEADEARRWEDVPPEIRRTFDRLGIPEAEQKALSGVGAQFDSDVVYHNLKKEWNEQGVIFENMDTAVRKYPDLVREHFMTQCVPVSDHKFAMLHAAVWSGGTFIYVPPGVAVTVPLQAYFRMNAERGGQFEHTLIIADEGATVEYIEGCSAPKYSTSSLHAGCVEIFVRRGATVRYSSIENWSKNTYNLNTKRALVDEDAAIEWLSGNMGSGKTMLYPCSILRGSHARAEALGIAFAGPGQEQDTGFKVVHAAPDTTATIRSKGLAKGGGKSVYRGVVQAVGRARGARCSVTCDTLILDTESSSDSWPRIVAENEEVELAHEARVGRIGDEEIFYLTSRGIDRDRAVKMVVGGFVAPVIRRLPLEYAVELNRLIDLEMEGAVG
jgi:Fe-S cluster assembly protein SufB